MYYDTLGLVKPNLIISFEFEFNYSLYSILYKNYRHSKLYIFVSILSIQVSTCCKYSPLVTNHSFIHLTNSSTSRESTRTSKIIDNLFITRLCSMNGFQHFIFTQQVTDRNTTNGCISRHRNHNLSWPPNIKA